MKLRKPLIILLCITALFMVACSEKNDFSGQAKVTFCLEGGSYQNSDRDVVQYYPVGEGSSKIVTPDKLSEKPIEKAGYYTPLKHSATLIGSLYGTNTCITISQISVKNNVPTALFRD